MATSAERLAAELADLKRRIIAMERGSQLAHSTFTTAAGDVVPVLDGVATGVQAKELADTLSAAQEELAADAAVRDTRLTEAESGLTAAQSRLDAAEADLTTAFGQIDTVDTKALDAQTAADSALIAAENAQAAADTADAKAADAATAAANAAGIADGKGKVLIQSTAPAVADQNSVTLWIDTTGGANTPKKWSGTAWTAVTDKAATDAANAAVAAQAAADAADAKAVAAQNAADIADAKAEGADAKAVAAQTAASSAQTAADVAHAAADAADARAADAMKAAVNVVRDPSFENGTWADSTWISDATTARTGTKSLRVDGVGAVKTLNVATSIPVKPGETWRFSVYAKTTPDYNGTVSNGKLRLGNGVSGAHLYSSGFNVSADWTAYTFEYVVPASGVASVTLSLNTNHTTGKIWFDDVEATNITNLKQALAAAQAAHDAADAADAKAVAAQTAAGNAQSTADNALTMAGSKGKVYYDTTAPSGTGTAAGDLWRRVDSSKNVIAEWYWTGSSWQSSQITTDAISNLDVGKLTAGSATIISAVAQKIAASTASFQTVDAKNLYVTDTAAIDTAVANALYAKKISAGKILAGEVLIGGGENRIPWDPTVVAPHTNWNSSVLTPINDVDLGRLIQSNLTGVTAGTYKTFMRLCSGATASNGRVNSFQVNEGEEYLVKVGIGLGGSYPGGSPKARVYVLFFDADGVQTTTAAGTGISGGYTAVPTYATLDVVIPAGTVSMDVYLQQEHDGNIFVHAPTLTRKTDASLIVTGGVKADKLESELTLSTKIIAGDVAGTHAEMSPSGFRVYAADSGGGAPAEVVRLGVAATDDYFAVTRADGSLAATISQDGKIVGDQVHATEELWYKGMELQAKLDSMPRGLVAAAYRDTDAAANAVSGGPSLPYLRLEVELERDRVYRIRTNQMRMGISSGTTALVVLGYAIGSIASPTNYATLAKYKQTDGETSDHVEELFALISGAQKQTVSFIILFAVYSGSGQCGLRAAGGEPIRLTVEDLGSSAATIGNGVWLDGAVTPPAAKNTYVKQYGSTGSMNYQGNNSQYVYDTGRMYQGLSPAGYGNLKSISIHPSMTADLSGATINYIRVYFNFDHWYYNAGGTARIGLHGFTSVPATFSGSGIAATSTNWPKPGARWVDLPSSVFAGFKSGTYKGVYLEGDSTYTTYGIAQRPTIEISYTK